MKNKSASFWSKKIVWIALAVLIVIALLVLASCFPVVPGPGPHIPPGHMFPHPRP